MSNPEVAGERRRWWRRLAIGLAGVVVAGYAGLAGYLFWAQSSMVFLPKRSLESTPQAWGVRFEPVTFDSEGQRLVGWWIPGDAGQPVVLFFHGNASVISGLRAHVALFRRLGLGVLLFDYRGYGLSEGAPSEAGLYADASAAYRYLRDDLGVSAERIVLYGHSLGGGVATWLAIRQAARALVLEGTFQSIPAVGQERYPYLPIRLLSRIGFDNLTRMPQVRMPVLIMHSRDDRVIPIHHGQALLAAVTAPKAFLETRGDHNTSVSQGGAEIEAGLRRFLDGL